MATAALNGHAVAEPRDRKFGAKIPPLVFRNTNKKSSDLPFKK